MKIQAVGLKLDLRKKRQRKRRPSRRKKAGFHGRDFMMMREGR